MSADLVESLAQKIDLRAMRLLEANRYYEGRQPLAFLSPASRRALGDRLQSLSANYVRLATDSISERLAIDDFKAGGQTLTDLRSVWTANSMADRHRIAITEALVTGQSFLLVWADPSGAPTISVESPHEMAIQRDPLTHQVTAALKRWRGDDGHARAMLFQGGSISEWVGAFVPVGGALPSRNWRHARTLANPLQTPPVVALTNSSRLFDDDGSPEARDIWGLVDALSKMLSDVMVASEATALPRRWVTGLAVVEDEAGNPVMPFNNAPGNVWLAEAPEVKMGSFPEPTLAGYESLINVLLRNLGALAGLPDHFMGFPGSEPASAEQIRASESSLVSRAYARQITFTPAFSRAAALAEAIRTGGPVRDDLEVVWRSPESRTRAAEADAAAKMWANGQGILPLEVIWASLGFTPSQIEEMRGSRVRQALDAAPLALPVAPASP